MNLGGHFNLIENRVEEVLDGKHKAGFKLAEFPP
jgi:hypothetical protein